MSLCVCIFVECYYIRVRARLTINIIIIIILGTKQDFMKSPPLKTLLPLKICP